jgi:WD40 repeat protein
MALASGTKLGPYEIQSLIGAGGMGEVYRARDSRLKRDVAVKVLPAALSQDADRLRRFEQEALATAALNHPNILAVFDIGTSDGSPYVVSELLEGETLRERLRSGALPTRRALDYALQTASGMASAHSKGILHRDLKPENLFITKDGRLKILDFGLAKLTQTEPSEQTSLATATLGTEAGLVLGTAGYMSPEQVRGQALDARSDIFGFGAILYEMLSGKRAFHGNTPADTMSSILKDEPAELSTTNLNVSPALERIVHHCLEKNPEARFHSASDIAFDLQHISDISASSAGKASGSVVQAKRRPWGWLAAAGALALLAGGLGWWTRGRGAQVAHPEYQLITFRRGSLGEARFAPDGTVVYSAHWDGGDSGLYLTRPGDPRARELGMKDAELLAVSSTGELATRLGTHGVGGLMEIGTLARSPAGGGTPREMLDNVADADWSPNGENLAVTRYLPESAHWRLEYPIGSVLLESVNWIDEVRVSPDGKWIAFADHENNFGDDEGSVAVIAANGKGQEKKLSSGWESLGGICWRGSGELWYSATLSGYAERLHAVTLEGKKRDIANVPGGMSLEDLRNGVALVETVAHWSGIRALAPGAKQERELSWFGGAYIGGLTADGRKLLSTDVGEGGGADYTIFLRDTDGSAPVTLGKGSGRALSADGNWIVTQPGTGGPLSLVPTGVGQARVLTHDAVNYDDMSFLPDGKQLLASGVEAGHGKRDYLISLAKGDSKPVTPEGTFGLEVSQDGKNAAVLGPDGKWSVWALDGSGARAIPGLDSKFDVINWSSDGKSLYVVPTEGDRRGSVSKVDLATGKINPWRILGQDTGDRVALPFVTPDGSGYAYMHISAIGNAYLVTGLQ